MNNIIISDQTQNDNFDIPSQDIFHQTGQLSETKIRCQLSKKLQLIKPQFNEVDQCNPEEITLEQIYSTYDPNQIPPDFTIANNHFLAWQTGAAVECDDEEDSKSKQQAKQQDKICECCARIIERKVPELQCDILQLSFLGSGYPLFFQFIKYCVVFLIIIIISSGGYNMISNKNYGNYCQQSSKCEDNWITSLSLINKMNNKELMKVQEIMNMISIFIMIILLQFLRKFQRKIDQDCDEADVSANDYTVLVRNIPIEYTAINDDYDDDLKAYFQKLIPDQFLVVTNVNLSYNIHSLLQIDMEKQKAIEYKQQALSDYHKIGKFNENVTLRQLDKNIYDIETKYNNLCAFFCDGKGTDFMKQYFTGWAFVSFNTEQTKQEVIDLFDKYNKDPNKFIYHGNKLLVEQAPYPTDVFWNNLHLQEKERFIRQLKSYFSTFLILICCFCAIAALMFLQKYAQQILGSGNPIVDFIGIVCSIVISVLNNVLEYFLFRVTNTEGCYTRTEFNISFAKKLTIAMFINTGLATFVIEAAFGDQNKENIEKLFGQGGIVYYQNYVFISNMIVPFLIQIVNPPYLIKKFQRKIEILKGNKSVMTQKQLNEIFEDPDFDIAVNYAVVLKTMYLVAFYSPIIPVGFLWSIGALILWYWCNKYNLLRKSSIKYSLGGDLSIEMTEMLEYFLPIYSGANVLFFAFILGVEEISATSYIGLGVGLIHAYLPMQWLNTKIFRVEEAPPNEQTYFEVEKYFFTNYDRENPATANKARQEFCFSKLMKAFGIDIKKEINQQQQQIQDQQQIEEQQNILEQQIQINEIPVKKEGIWLKAAKSAKIKIQQRKQIQLQGEIEITSERHIQIDVRKKRKSVRENSSMKRSQTIRESQKSQRKISIDKDQRKSVNIKETLHPKSPSNAIAFTSNALALTSNENLQSDQTNYGAQLKPINVKNQAFLTKQFTKTKSTVDTKLQENETNNNNAEK